LEAGSGIEPLYTDLQSRRLRYPGYSQKRFLLAESTLVRGKSSSKPTPPFPTIPGMITQEMHCPSAAKENGASLI